MNTVAYFGELIYYTLEFSSSLWYVTIPLFAFFVWSLFDMFSQRRKLSGSEKTSLMLVILLPLALLLIGTAFPADLTRPKVANLSLLSLHMLGVVGGILWCGSIVYGNGDRLGLVAIAAFGGWVSFWCFFVSWMSVLGDSL
jgi:hypothetical protein